jgi:DNA-binding NarL/FixJ family response regulator
LLRHFNKSAKAPAALVTLIATQTVCAIFFMADVVADYMEAGIAGSHDWHFYIEFVASLSLVTAVSLEVAYLMELLQQRDRLKGNLAIAKSAVHDVIEMHCKAWNLTPTEQDVATFLVKGCNIAEIAELRGTAEGTIKAHLNAIYKKSGTRNKTEVLSLLLDSMMGGNGGADTPAWMPAENSGTPLTARP